jgi:hypothetical protein
MKDNDKIKKDSKHWDDPDWIDFILMILVLITVILTIFHYI